MFSIGDINVFEDKIGHGTFSSVFKAEQYDTRNAESPSITAIAVKKMRLENKKNYEREKSMLSKLNSDYIIKIKETFEKTIEEKMFYFIVYPLYDYNLLDYLKENKLTMKQIKYISKSIIGGLLHLYQNYIVHCDIKPANILIKGEKVVICDFSNSIYHNNIDINDFNENPLCTLWYRPPEQIVYTVKTKTKSDIWSLGCVLFEMVCSNSILFDCLSNKNDNYNKNIVEYYDNLSILYNHENLIGKIDYQDTRYFKYDELNIILSHNKYYIDSKKSLGAYFWSNLNKEYIKKERMHLLVYFKMIEECLCIDPDKRVNLHDLYTKEWFDELLSIETERESKRIKI